MKKNEYDIVVLGAGVVGSSIAYHLSETKKHRILIIDQGYPVSGTSGATHACVNVHSKIPSSYGEFSLYSSELYRFLDRKIGDFEYKRTGSVQPVFTEKEKHDALLLMEEQAKVGIDIKMIDKEEVLEKIPSSTQDLLGAIFSPVDGHLNPFRLVDLYLKAAKKNGLDSSFYNKVVHIERNRSNYTLVTEKGTFKTKKLILAVGPWIKEVGKWLNLHIPVKQIRGQILVTEPIEPILKPQFGAMHQADNGEILIGFSQEEVGLNRGTTLEIIQRTAAMAVRMMPALSKINIVRTFAGIRVVPVDGFPILGEVPENENLYIASTHSGITLSPLIGTLLTELINEGETSIPIDEYNLARFNKCV